MEFLLQPLTLVTFFPLLGVLVLLFLPSEKKNLLRWTAMRRAVKESFCAIDASSMRQLASSQPLFRPCLLYTSPSPRDRS